MKTIKTIGKIFYWLILVALVVIATFTTLSALKLPNSYKLMIVLSGSMEPKIHTGSVVFVKPSDNYFKGDIITFSDGQTETPTTHRIQEIQNKDGQNIYITKGDANSGVDTTETKKDQIIGKTLFSIPYIGYAVNFAKTQLGLIILIIIPAVIIIYSEFLSIKSEIVRLIKKKKDEKTSI